MNLNYSILWFDDEEEYFESLPKDAIEEALESWGFRLNITPVHNADEFNKLAPFKQFDMMVVDFKLGDERGETFIKSVRDQQVFTEVIFYSISESRELWQAVYDQQLEGVYVTNKRGIEQKLIRVAHQSVHKVLDLENMRGIVMSEVGDLDALLGNIFVKAMNGISDANQKNVFERFHEKASEQQKQFADALATFKESPSIDRLLGLCDSDKRWQSFNRVKKHHDLLKGNNFEGDYSKEILWPRNCLAHGTPERKADGTLLFRHSNKEYLFDEGVSQDLRKKIIEYKNAFTEIVGLLE